MNLSSYLATYLSRDSQKSLIGFELMKQPKLALLSIGEPCRFNCLSFPTSGMANACHHVYVLMCDFGKSPHRALNLRSLQTEPSPSPVLGIYQ